LGIYLYTFCNNISNNLGEFMNFYFSKDEEGFCYSLDYFDDGTILNLAEVDTDKSHFYCRAHGEPYEKEDSCGKVCSEYEPRNGRSGMCKHQGRCFVPTGNYFIKQGKKAIKVEDK